MPSIAKKRHLRKIYRKYFLGCFQQIDSMETSGSVFAEKIEQVEKTIYELELVITVEYFPDGCGSHSNYLVTFGIKSWYTDHFSKPKEIKKLWTVSVNEIAIKSIVSPTKHKKPTNKQVSQVIRQTQFEHSSYSFFNSPFLLETEKQTKSQILNQNFHNASDFELEKFRHSRFWNENCTTCQSFIWIFFPSFDFSHGNL